MKANHVTPVIIVEFNNEMLSIINSENILNIVKNNIKSIISVNNSVLELFKFETIGEFKKYILDSKIIVNAKNKLEIGISHEKHAKICFVSTYFIDENNPNKVYITLTNISKYRKIIKNNTAFADAFEVSTQPILLANTEGYIIHTNKSFDDYYGYDENELKGQRANIFNPGKATYNNLGYSEKEYHELFMSLWRDISDSNIGYWNNLVINKTKDGKLLWVRLIVYAVYDKENKNKIKYYVGMPIDISKTITEHNKSKMDLYIAIANLAELRDQETSNHMKRVGLFSKILAKGLGKTDKFCNDMEVFASMHDIGKVGISDSILLAERKLTKDEFIAMQKHTVIGHRIVKDKKELETVAEITLSHHEKFNGLGYPNGLKGEEIPLSARVTAIADVYDALRSKRPYKKRWTHQEAVDEILKSSGSHFDPNIIKVFKKCEENFKNIYSELRD